MGLLEAERTVVVLDPPATRPSRRSLAAVLMLTIAAAVLGAINLTTSPLTIDETATRLYATTHGVAGAGEDGGNMAAYYLLIHVLVTHFGISRLVLRLPSVLFGAATVPVVALLGRRVKDARLGVLAAALYALSLPLIAEEHIPRAYTMGPLLVSAGVLSWLSLWRRPGLVRAAMYVLVTTIASYTLLFNWWVMLAEALTWVWWGVSSRRGISDRGERASMKWVGISMLVAACCSAQMIYLAAGKGFAQLDVVLDRTSYSAVVHTALVLASAGNGTAPSSWTLFAALLALATIVLWMIGILRVRHDQTVAHGSHERRLVVPLYVLWLVLPVVGAIVVSVVLHPIYQDRYFMICLPPAAILAASGLEWVRERGIAVYTACVSLVLGAHVAFLVQFYRS